MQQQELGRFQACSLLERLIDQAKLLYQVHSVLIDFRLRRERALAQTKKMIVDQREDLRFGQRRTPMQNQMRNWNLHRYAM